MDLLTGIQNRISAARLTEPGPTREQLEQIIRAGARAPDHGRLRPWRFVVIEGDARRRLADAMAALLKQKLPEATPDQLDAERAKAMRAPVVIVAAARIARGGKIPEIEQICAVAAGVQNMFLTANALGYGAMWKTGAAAYDASVKTALGLQADDHIVSFLYIGTLAVPGHASTSEPESLTTWLPAG